MALHLLHILDRVLQRRRLHGPVIVAVSGGPDSVALLHALHQLDLSNLQLHVAHYNHRLRGQDSVDDARYVAELAKHLSVPFHSGVARDGELSAGQSHLEATARQLRYSWLTTLAENLQSGWILTGHTMNDQAETVLHHLIRGTGWRGLRGIAPMRTLSKSDQRICVLRPLLQCTRHDVLDYLASHNITARHDASNDDMKFTRNRIRHQIMPQLIEMNPDAVKHLAEWADRARMVYRRIKTDSRRLFETIIAFQSKERLAIKLKPLERNSNTVLQEVLRGLFQSQNWPVDQMNHQRWKETIEVCRGTRTAVELPGKIMVTRKDLVVQFIKR